LLLHVVDASNPDAEEHVKAVNAVLAELGCATKPTLLVLNKIDQMQDPSFLQVLQSHHPRAVAISAGRREGLDTLAESVMEILAADFAHAEVVADPGNGKVLAYLGAHAEIYRQEYRDGKVVILCYLPRHLLHHIQGPDVQVRFLEGSVLAR
jgi:GTPase